MANRLLAWTLAAWMIGSVHARLATADAYGTPGSDYVNVTNFGNATSFPGATYTHTGNPLPTSTGQLLIYGGAFAELTSTFVSGPPFTSGSGDAYSFASLTGGVLRAFASGADDPAAIGVGGGARAVAQLGARITIESPIAGSVTIQMLTDADYSVPQTPGSNRARFTADLIAYVAGTTSSAYGEDHAGTGDIFYNQAPGHFEDVLEITIPITAGLFGFDLKASIDAFVEGPGIMDALNTAVFQIQGPQGFQVRGALTFQTPSGAVPEPSTLLLLGTILLAIAGVSVARSLAMVVPLL